MYIDLRFGKHKSLLPNSHELYETHVCFAPKYACLEKLDSIKVEKHTGKFCQTCSTGNENKV